MLPEGSVRASREDIVNKRSVLEFVGGYDDIIPSPSCISYSLADGYNPKDEYPHLSEIKLCFDAPVSLVPGKPIKLYEANKPENVFCEILPALSYLDDTKSAITVNLNIYLDSEIVYTVEIPEGTVVTTKGDIAVNKIQRVNIGSTGLSEYEIDESDIKVNGKSIAVSGIDSADTITLYDISGRVVKTISNPSETVTMDVENGGIYILAVGGKTYKVVIR